MIDWLREYVLSNQTAIGLALLAGLLVALFVVHHVVYRAVGRRVRRRGEAEFSFLRRTKSSTLITGLFVVLLVVRPVLPIPEETSQTVLEFLRAGLIASITWFIISGVSTIDDLVMARHDVSQRDNLKARRVHTRARVLTRTAMIVIGVGGAAGVLMSFPEVRQVGTGLLASAGLAGLAVGFAAKPTLGNLIAGLQIAITEPIRLGDAVIVENEWGWIEEITATYVVIKIWDERRLIVPLSYFIETPFQNWTRTKADIIGSVEFHVDYTCPIALLEQELDRILDGHPLWDGRVKVLQVTEAGEKTMKLRVLVSAGDSPTAWDLRCDVRKRLILWLQEHHRGALPKHRVERLELGEDGPGPGSSV